MLRKQKDSTGSKQEASSHYRYSPSDLDKLSPEETKNLLLELLEREKESEERNQVEIHQQQVEKFESLKVMAGSIAHNFNNLLMGVLGNLELALSVMPPGESGRRNIEMADKAAKRATELSRLMLTYVGKSHVNLEATDLVINVRQILRVLRNTCPENVKMSFKPEEIKIFIDGDPVQVRQVVMHLVNNAVEAVNDKKGEVIVSAGKMYCCSEFLGKQFLGENLREGEYAYLEVKDDGCGMSQGVLKKVFDPFFTTKFIGRGLGLPAVVGIVSAHHGSIQINSEEGKGTSVRVLFPMGTAPKGVVKKEIHRKKEQPLAGTLLLADDEEMVLDVGKAMLEQLGFRVIVAADGQEALEKFRKSPDEINCVLLDLTMPKMDGAEVFREIRKLRQDIPVILTSGYSEEEVAEYFSEIVPNAYLEKPFQLAKLTERIHNVLMR